MLRLAAAQYYFNDVAICYVLYFRFLDYYVTFSHNESHGAMSLSLELRRYSVVNGLASLLRRIECITP